MRQYGYGLCAFVLLLVGCSQGQDEQAAEYLPRLTGKEGTNMPVLFPDGTAEFRIYVEGVTQVALAGTFNGWNPYLYTMERMESNTNVFVYHLSNLDVTQVYLYRFVVDGYAIADPDNPYTVADDADGVYSVLDKRVLFEATNAVSRTNVPLPKETHAASNRDMPKRKGE